MSTKTPENPLIDFIDHSGVNTLKSSDMHRAFVRLDGDASDEEVHDAEIAVSYLVDTASDFVCSSVLGAPDEERGEVAEQVWEQVVEATDMIVLGPEHPDVCSKSPDVQFSLDDLIPDESVRVNPKEKANWRTRVRNLVGPLVKKEVDLYVAC